MRSFLLLPAAPNPACANAIGFTPAFVSLPTPAALLLSSCCYCFGNALCYSACFPAAFGYGSACLWLTKARTDRGDTAQGCCPGARLYTCGQQQAWWFTSCCSCITFIARAQPLYVIESSCRSLLRKLPFNRANQQSRGHMTPAVQCMPQTWQVHFLQIPCTSVLITATVHALNNMLGRDPGPAASLPSHSSRPGSFRCACTSMTPACMPAQACSACLCTSGKVLLPRFDPAFAPWL
jgi:hypothetical protein